MPHDDERETFYSLRFTESKGAVTVDLFGEDPYEELATQVASTKDEAIHLLISTITFEEN